MTSSISLAEPLAHVLNESDLLCVPSRRQAGETLEMAIEMTLIGEPRFGCYFRQRATPTDQPLRLANADLS